MTDVVKKDPKPLDAKDDAKATATPTPTRRESYVPKRGDYVRYGEDIGRVHSVQFDKLEPDGSVSPDAKAVFITFVSINDNMELKSEVVPVAKIVSPK